MGSEGNELTREGIERLKKGDAQQERKGRKEWESEGNQLKV